MLIGIIALLTGKTGDIITLSVLGALTLYILGMVSLLYLRKKEPGLERPFDPPFYPYFPLVALVIGSICLVAMVTLNGILSLIDSCGLALSYIWFHFFVKPNNDAAEIFYP